jgi:hypothetical protein
VIVVSVLVLQVWDFVRSMRSGESRTGR